MKPSDTPKDAPKAAEKPKSKLPMLIGVALVLFVVGAASGFGSAWCYSRGGSGEGEEESSEGEEEGKSKDPHKAEKSEHGKGHGKSSEADAKTSTEIAPNKHLVALGDYMVNLRGASGARVLRMQIQAMGSAEAADACTLQEAPIRDAILTLASDYTYADLDGLDGKVHLRDELLRRVNAIIRPAKVESLYFTAFVVQ